MVLALHGMAWYEGTVFGLDWTGWLRFIELESMPPSLVEAVE